MKLAVLFLMCIAAVISVSGKAPVQFFCGRRLANTLALFCPNSQLSKRSGESYEHSYYHTGSDLLPATDDDLFGGLGLGGNNYVSMRDSWKWRGALKSARGKRGVVSECCDQPCTLDELLTYC
ncbi:unnamed protein product [Diatraea saccharalis]|uniref:Insulin-like domain-containing protein n=1 Tax=Diatraea saccharalis TaxID=40085 RepID=A0A9N9WIU4_9NEOP|nr:unnamed protein product [Diatraea saccharalis]